MSLKTSKSNANETQLAIDYWQLFRDLPESYILLRADDPLFTIVEMNTARERLTHKTRAEALHKPFFSVYPDVTDKYKQTGQSTTLEYFREVIHTGKTKKLGIFRYDITDKQGKLAPRYWQSTYIPLKMNGQSVTHVLAITKDVSNEQETERRILDAEERLSAALDIGKVGSWTWDVQSDVVVADRRLARLFNLDAKVAAKGLPMEAFIKLIHEDDRQRVERAIRTTIKKQVLFDEEYRTCSLDNRTHWVFARGQVEQMPQGQVFTGVIVDISERRDLQAQIALARQQDRLNRQAAKILQARNEELEAISRTKDEFVALASHQLRTPATAVKQYVGMVLQGYVGDVSELQTDMLEKAFESNERQIQIINQILNAARVDTGRLVMTLAPLDLRTMVRGVADDMRATFIQRHHTFKLSLPRQPVSVLADLSYLRMAIENILNNACVYTPENGTITMKLVKSGESCILSITDTGVGIKKADRAKLFEKFSRIHNPLSVQAGGSGIGLYLAGEIVRLHHGTVHVQSKIHQGSTFAICLPIVQN